MGLDNWGSGNKRPKVKEANPEGKGLATALGMDRVAGSAPSDHPAGDVDITVVTIDQPQVGPLPPCPLVPKLIDAPALSLEQLGEEAKDLAALIQERLNAAHVVLILDREVEDWLRRVEALESSLEGRGLLHLLQREALNAEALSFEMDLASLLDTVEEEIEVALGEVGSALDWLASVLGGPRVDIPEAVSGAWSQVGQARGYLCALLKKRDSLKGMR